MSWKQRGYLTPISTEHLSMVLEWRNKDDIRRNMYSEDIITYEQHKQWFESLKNNLTKRTYVYYLYDKPVGIVNYNLDLPNERCEWGFYIGEGEVPKGAGSLLGYLAIENAFNNLNVRKITGEVFDFNKKSHSFHLRLGFSKEGILKEHIKKNDGFKDIIIYGLFYREWQLQKKAVFDFLTTVLKER